jgi:hypothetical protein
VRSLEDDAWSVAAINRNDQALEVQFRLPGAALARPWRVFVFDPADPPFHPFGDLPPAVAELSVNVDGAWSYPVPAHGLVVFTTAYDPEPPAPVRRLACAGDAGEEARLQWLPAVPEEVCYYRIYARRRDRWEQLGSTVGTGFVCRRSGGADTFAVTVVDRSGNESGFRHLDLPAPDTDER